MIEMGTGKPPWPEFRNNLAALFHVATSTTPPTPPAHFSDKARHLKRLCIDPKERPAASTLASDPLMLWLARSRRRKRRPLLPLLPHAVVRTGPH